MSLTARDKKLLMLIVPIAAVLALWFLVVGPQRSEVSKLDEQLASVERGRDAAVQNAQQLEASKNAYAGDYATVVRLGKAIPSRLDMPSLLVQLDSAAKGAKIDFDSIAVSERQAAPAGTGAGGGAGAGAPAAEAGGAPAQTGAGQAAETANEGAATADSASAAREGGSAGAGQTGANGQSTSGVAGLDTVPLEFEFKGSYFDLADFLHRVKRFVRVANEDVDVKGRLMTIEGVDFSPTGPTGSAVTATISANVYLSPEQQGANAGGSPQGPNGSPSQAPASATTGAASP